MYVSIDRSNILDCYVDKNVPKNIIIIYHYHARSQYVSFTGIQSNKVKRHCFGVWSAQKKCYPNFKLLVRFLFLVV